MNWNISKQGRYYLASAIILMAGLGGAALIYLTAADEPEDAMVTQYEMTKAYRHDLELFGGTANVLAVEFTQWLEGLWHGKQLAFTVGCIAILVAFCVFVFGRYIETDISSGPET